MDNTSILLGKSIYNDFFSKELALAKKYIWIATANIKNMYIPIGGKYRSILHLFEKLISEGVCIRILFSSEPSRSFDAELDKHPLLRNERFEMLSCLRNHMKTVIIDSSVAYTGSANFTGAGLGGKSENKRNFEVGYLTREKKEISILADYFDSIWMGTHCNSCLIKNCSGVE